VIPCVYIFKGKQKHLERLINLFAKLTAKLGTSNQLSKSNKTYKRFTDYY